MGRVGLGSEDDGDSLDAGDESLIYSKADDAYDEYKKRTLKQLESGHFSTSSSSSSSSSDGEELDEFD